MLNEQAMENEEVLSGLRILNNKHRDFLNGEGKWLVDGFETIVTLDAANGNAENPNLVIKKEIYMMLPSEIRADIQKLIEIE